jgi:hypothetical protein
MKLTLLSFFFVIAVSVNAQSNNLPAGRYETILKQSQSKWSQGDIILVDANHYKITSSEEPGEYKFSSTAQRIIFISGPLKTVYAKTAMNGEKPTIILPFAENEQQGVKLVTGDVIAYFKN